MLGFESREDYRRARDVLSDAQYTYDGIVETLGDDEWFTPRAIDMPRFERLLRGPSRLHTFLACRRRRRRSATHNIGHVGKRKTDQASTGRRQGP